MDRNLWHFLPWMEKDPQSRYEATSRLILYLTLVFYALRRRMDQASVGLVFWVLHRGLGAPPPPPPPVEVLQTKNEALKQLLDDAPMIQRIIDGPRQALSRRIVTSSEVEKKYGERQVRKNADPLLDDNLFQLNRGGAGKFYLNPKHLG